MALRAALAAASLTAAAAAPFALLPHAGPLPLPTKQQLAYQGEISP